MNRQSLSRWIGGVVISVLAGLFGFRPKTLEVPEPLVCQWGDWYPGPPMSEGETCTTTLVNPGDDEPLRLWFNDRFYVDLPEDRYTDSVVIDWVYAREWPKPECEFYVARCQVSPEIGEPWEVLSMRRVDG